MHKGIQFTMYSYEVQGTKKLSFKYHPKITDTLCLHASRLASDYRYAFATILTSSPFLTSFALQIHIN